jgi:putative transcriptional regulator
MPPSNPAPSTPVTSGLAPGLLVASPTLGDPNFDGSVVLMAEHHAEGALGFIVNRPGPITVVDVLRGLDPDLAADALRNGRASGQVMEGGPVQPDRLWILYRPGEVPAEDGATRVGQDLALGGSRELLESLVRTRQGGPFLLVLGYAGWAPMQVEQEVNQGAWIPMALHEDLVFDVPNEARWDQALRRIGLEPGSFMVAGGGAQA